MASVREPVMVTIEEVRAARARKPNITLWAGDYEVTLATACLDCQGTGVRWNPLWREWTEALGLNPCTDEYLQAHPFPDCPEEDGCGECDATGYVITENGAAIQKLMGLQS